MSYKKESEADEKVIETRYNSSTPKCNSLREQLTQLNIRSRWYSELEWKLAFTYLAATGIFLGFFKNQSSISFIAALALSSIIGGFALYHLGQLTKSNPQIFSFPSKLYNKVYQFTA